MMKPTDYFFNGQESKRRKVSTSKPLTSYTSMKDSNSPQQNHNVSHGPISILWDMENCAVPSGVPPEDVASNILTALRLHPVINGVVKMFSAFGDFNSFSRRLREGCQRTGVKLVDVPNGRKDAADKAILVDMFLFALDNPPPSSIMLISGDVDFSHALHVLGQRGYNVILVIPSKIGVSSALSNAGRYVWDWSSVARGEGFTPFLGFGTRASDVSGFVTGSRPQIGDNTVAKNEEESIVHPEVNGSKPSGLTGDLTGLKTQLTKLLESFGGCLPVASVHSEYRKCFGRPLLASDYGFSKLKNILKKMSNVISVEGKGTEKLMYLKNINHGRKENGIGDENTGDDANEILNRCKCELQEILVVQKSCAPQEAASTWSHVSRGSLSAAASGFGQDSIPRGIPSLCGPRFLIKPRRSVPWKRDAQNLSSESVPSPTRAEVNTDSNAVCIVVDEGDRAQREKMSEQEPQLI